MILYYLDASAWVKRHYKETGTKTIQTLFESGVALGSASLGLIEVIATLTRKHKAGQFTPEGFRRAIEDVKQDWVALTQVELDDEAVERAQTTAQSFALRGGDAIHLASALILRELLAEKDEIVFVTSDKELKAAAIASGLAVLDPSQERA